MPAEPVPEEEFLAACREGRDIDGADGGTRRTVSAALIRRCCYGLKDQVDPHGLRLRNADIRGQLDLAALTVPFPLRFDQCGFDTELTAEGAVLHELALTGCTQLPGLLANGLRVRRDLDLSRSFITGAHWTSASTSRRSAIWLCESSIGGRLLFEDTVIEAGGQCAVQADEMRVGGTVRFLHNFTARGDLRLRGVHIEGALNLTGARIESATGVALDLTEAAIGGSIVLSDGRTRRRPVIKGRIELGSASVTGRLIIGNADLQGPPAPKGTATARKGTATVPEGTATVPEGTATVPDGTPAAWPSSKALSARRLSVGAEVTLEGKCVITGGVDLSMSELSGLSVGGACTLSAPGRVALNLTNAELHSDLAMFPGATMHGTMRLAGAHIGGNLLLRGARLDEPYNGSAVAGQGVTVDGDVELGRLQVTGGQLGFRGARLGGAVSAEGAQLFGPAGLTLNLHQAVVGGTVKLVNGFCSDGLVGLGRCSIGGRLQCTNAEFSCPQPNERNKGLAIEAVSATITGGIELGGSVITHGVDFTNASTTYLADDPACWPEQFTVSGFRYDRFGRSEEAAGGQTWDRVARCDWLSRQEPYDRGPYEQAARVFRQHGYASEADEILIAQRRRARGSTSSALDAPRRAVDLLYDVTVRYGYRPGRVLWALAGLLIAVIITLAIPAGQATLRASSNNGAVFTTTGPLQPTASQSQSGQSQSGQSPTADPCGDGQVRCFNPVFYAIDTVVPLVSLDQRSAWYPDSHVRFGTLMNWWLNIATLLGWLLSSILVLSLARLARSS